MPTLQDARAAETEARNMAWAMMTVDRYGNLDEGDVDESARRLDALAAAIEARVRCELAEKVRGMEFSVPLGGDTPMLRRSAVLRLLGEMER